MSPIFFDSWGKAWITCDGDHDGARAFGPTGVARKLTMHWNDFDRRDIIQGDDGWWYLKSSAASLLLAGGL